MKKSIERIADYYGIESQCHQLVEEMAELIQALNKLYRAKKVPDVDLRTFYDHIAEEMADVSICMKQVEYLMNLTEQIQAYSDEKIIRQTMRMHKEVT